MMRIRKYKNSDWKRLCEIHDLARIDELTGSVDLDAFLDLEATAENEGLFDGELWLLEEDSKVLAFIAFDEDEITWLYVDPAHYNQGMGRKLIQFAKTRIQGNITIEVLSGNKPALHLYKSEGFEVVKKVNGKLTGNESFEAEGYILVFKRRGVRSEE